MIYKLSVINQSFRDTIGTLLSNQTQVLALSDSEKYFSQVANRLFFAAALKCDGDIHI
jgi:hypothetical protein